MSSKKEKGALELTKYQTIEDSMKGGADEENDNDLSQTLPWYLIGGIAVVMVVLAFWFSGYESFNEDNTNQKFWNMNETFDSRGRYVMNNFDEAKPMSNFLPALGGLWGVPMWAFFVNRGQGIASFGIKNKDGGIAKFNTAEKAYQQTPFTGFRTFVKGKYGSKYFEAMPFSPHYADVSSDSKPFRKMSMGMNEMEINEYNPVTKLRTGILYFTVPHEDFACLVRRVTFTNEGSEEMQLEVLDGLAKLEPSGIPHGNLDSMGRTMEGWMNVYNMEEGSNKTHPFFHASQGTDDTAEVKTIKHGHFSLAYIEDGNGPFHDPLPFIVDPNVVFGVDTILTFPSQFFGAKGMPVDKLLQEPQGTTSRTPCAYAGAKLVLKPGQNISLVSSYGHAMSLEQFTQIYSPKLLKKGYVSKRRIMAEELVDDITKRVTTDTKSSIFNAYIKQNFLDNVLRGGLPVIVGKDDTLDVDQEAVLKDSNVNKSKIYHVFSRIHGDLERDYNNFNIDTTYFSQGPGNFRDVNQNRRSDVMHTPEVGDFDLRMFLSFVQADGYNPLTVSSTLFRVPASMLQQVISSLKISDSSQREKARKLLSDSFRPGELLENMKSSGVSFGVNREEALCVILNKSLQEYAAQYAQNGFWADHWTYTLDLIESFNAIFPDKEEEMLWHSAGIPFFLSPSVVNPRRIRYIEVVDELTGNKTVRAYDSVTQWGEEGFPSARKNALMKVMQSPSYLHAADGSGGVWQQTSSGNTFKVPPVTKLSMLAIIKFSTMDPFGMGVEMEGGKPGWNDAMNGLPGLLGSGMAETYELLRIVRYVRQVVLKYDKGVSFPEEFSALMDGLSLALEKFESSDFDADDDYEYWDKSNDLREQYRHETVAVFSGVMIEWHSKQLVSFLNQIEKKAMRGIKRALKTNGGLSPTYFFYECTEYEVAAENVSTTLKLIIPKKFELRTLPLFLEGPVRYLKIIDDIGKKRDVYLKTKRSDLYDSELQMFKISGSLKSMPQEIGRMMAFSPGWLENESVWLHMSYKFYFELLKGGLFDEFFLEVSSGLVPFMNPSIYGRSPLEAASFIVSSSFPDENLHGSSFLARLSGSTAEFLSMWQYMTQGPNPFKQNADGEVVLSFQPALPRWLFKSDGTVSFTFLGVCKVTYHNKLFQDTWNMRAERYVVVMKSGKAHHVRGLVIGHELAIATRNLEVKSIDVYFT